MYNFIEFLTEENAHNSAFGAAYETATALHVHKMSGSAKNNDPAHKSRIKAITKAHKQAISSLPKHLQQKAISHGRASAVAYLSAMKQHHNVNPSDIKEVHHTPNGPGHLIGRTLNRADNPHDITVRLKKPVHFGGAHIDPSDVHGASLKATEGTASNNGIGAFDKKSIAHGIKSNVSGAFHKAMEKTGLASDKATRKLQVSKNPNKFKAGYQGAQTTAAKHFTKAFNSSSLDSQKRHITDMLRLKPDLLMHKVNGEKGTSIPTSESPHAKAIAQAKSITATHQTNGMIHYHDHTGAQIARSDIRTTHSGYTGAQHNYMLGSLKKRNDT